MALKTFNIAGIELKDRYVQAPLAGFSTITMRNFAHRYGAGLSYTEMISANALFYGSQDTFEMLHDTQRDEGPLALQLFGYEIDHIEKAIEIVEKEAKYTFLDFNLGCPVPKVMKQNAGSHLLTDLSYLYKLMSAIVKKSNHPVVAKTRLGFSNPEDITKIVKVLEDAGVKAIAIHGRTRSQFYTGHADYNYIAKAKSIANVPIIANGDIDEKNAKDVFDLTKADALMIGRAAVGNPLIFKDLVDLEEGNPLTIRTYKDNLEILKEYIDYSYGFERDAHKVSLALRTIAPAFLTGLPSIKKIRTLMVHCNSKEEYIELIDKALNGEIE